MEDKNISYVVICFQICIFDILNTAMTPRELQSIML